MQVQREVLIRHTSIYQPTWSNGWYPMCNLHLSLLCTTACLDVFSTSVNITTAKIPEDNCNFHWNIQFIQTNDSSSPRTETFYTLLVVHEFLDHLTLTSQEGTREFHTLYYKDTNLSHYCPPGHIQVSYIQWSSCQHWGLQMHIQHGCRELEWCHQL
jgi:hypothetical protein